MNESKRKGLPKDLPSLVFFHKKNTERVSRDPVPLDAKPDKSELRGPNRKRAKLPLKNSPKFSRWKFQLDRTDWKGGRQWTRWCTGSKKLALEEWKINTKISDSNPRIMWIRNICRFLIDRICISSNSTDFSCEKKIILSEISKILRKR